MNADDKYDWAKHARPEQLPPDGDWRVWLISAGRGWGKSMAAAQWVRTKARTCKFVNLIGHSMADIRDIMLEGPSGLLTICPPDERPAYQLSKQKLHWPNGGVSMLFAADEPERLRGKQHEALWCEEITSWPTTDTWEQAMLGLRIGPAQAVVTATVWENLQGPLKAEMNKLVKEIEGYPTTRVTRGMTWENTALDPAFVKRIRDRYESPKGRAGPGM
jgi:phage terminase large subunit-like protein